jgi:hypothetical integral membrane protein (TIGR02206 family)
MDWPALWRGGWPGESFSLGCPSHLVTLAVLALLVASFPLLRGPRRAGLRAAFRYTAAGLLIGVEALLHLWAYTNGEWTVRTMLPLQLCSVSQYLGAVMLLTRSNRLYQYVYYTAIAGALPALLTPSLVGYGFPHFRFWEYVITHVLIVCAPLYMTLAEGCRPRPGSAGRVIVAMNVFIAFAGALNWLIGSNYLFLSEKPGGPTPFDYLCPWPWYVVGLEVMGILAVMLLYSPFAVRDWWANRARVCLAAKPVLATRMRLAKRSGSGVESHQRSASRGANVAEANHADG